MIDLNELFKIAYPITENFKNQSKYTYLAYTRNLKNYKLINLNVLLTNNIKKTQDLPDNIYDFIGQEGTVLMIANILNDKVVSIIFRSLKQKRFTDLHAGLSYPYGIGNLKGFKFGMPLVIVEGPFDTDSLKEIYPYVIATMTAGLSNFQKELVLTLTNFFILIYDMDKSGVYAYNRDRKYLKAKKRVVETLNLPRGIKDVGELIELEREGKEFDCEDLKFYIKTHISIIQ